MNKNKEKSKDEQWKEVVGKELVLQLPRGVKWHIRHEKARIRSEFQDPQERKDMIEKLYKNFIYFSSKTKPKKPQKSATKKK